MPKINNSRPTTHRVMDPHQEPKPRLKKPKLVNRGGFGLYRKLTDKDKPKNGKAVVEISEVDFDRCLKDNIAEGLLGCVVPIEILVPDPMNARVHTDRNMLAIKQSLAVYGQMKPLVVRKEGNIVIAGNGTLQAAKELGWTKVAVMIKDMHPAEAAGYGISDNRSAEFARWNVEMIAIIDEMVREQNLVMAGWTSDELEVLRAAEWLPPPIEDDEGAFKGKTFRTLKFNPEQIPYLDKTIEAVRKREKSLTKASAEECIIFALREWMGEEWNGTEFIEESDAEDQ